MGKSNGSNNVPGWVKRDLQMLKRVSVSLVDLNRQTRLEMVEMHRENQRRMAANEKILSEMRQDFSELRRQTDTLKRTSDIHSKAILKLLKKSDL